MKNWVGMIYIIMAVCFMGCSGTKNIGDAELYNGTWVLEYISGPKISFNGLYPNKKPRISFDKKTEKVRGTNSCNGYSANFSLDGNKVSFGPPGPTTMMYCGEGEKVFLKMMQRINMFTIDSNGKLVLKSGDISLMRFHKVPNP